MSRCNTWSSFAIELEGYDTDDVLSPIKGAQRAMPVKRSNATLTSPAPAGKKATPQKASGAVAKRQHTPALEATVAPSPQQPRSSAHKRKSGPTAAVREGTPAVHTASQENQPSNLRSSRRAGSPQRDGSVQPPTKRPRGSSRSKSPGAAAGTQGAAGRRSGKQAAAPEPRPEQQQQPPAVGGGSSKKRRRGVQGQPAQEEAVAQQQRMPAQQQQQQQRQEAEPCGLATRPSTNSMSMMTSMGPQRSESMMTSILKSPTPPRRTQSVSVQRSIPFQMQLPGGVMGAVVAPLAALAGAGPGDQPAVDQPPPGMGAAAAAAAAAAAPAGALAAAQHGPQQHAAAVAGQQGAAGAAARAEAAPTPEEVAQLAAAEGRGESPVAADQLAAAVAEEGGGESPPTVEGLAAGAAAEATDAPPAAAQAAFNVAAAAAAADLKEGRLSIAPCCNVLATPAEPAAVAAGAAAPQHAAAARRQSPRLKQQEGAPGPKNSGGSGGQAGGAVRFSLPQGAPASSKKPPSPRSPGDSEQTANRSTARQGGGKGTGSATPISKQLGAGLLMGDASWFDPLEAEKVSRARAVLALGSAQAAGQIPLCREREVRQVEAFLSKHLSQGVGSSLYVSGLPGTGKSLTVQELVRQCPRFVGAAPTAAAAAAGDKGASAGTAAAAAAGAAAAALPPALITINCLNLLDPHHVVDKVLGCYHEACSRSPAPTGAEGEEIEDPLVRPSAEQPTFGSEALEQLTWLVLWPPAAAGAAAGKGGSGKRKGGSGGGKSRGRVGGGNGGGAAGGSTAAAGGRGMVVVVLDDMDGLLNNTASGSVWVQLPPPSLGAAQ